MAVAHLLNREVEVWRNVRTSDGSGGWVKVMVFSHTLPVRLSRANVAEKVFARTAIGPMQGDAELTHIAYLDDGSDVLRGDEWIDPEFEEKFRVIGFQKSTNPETYIRVECETLLFEPFSAEVDS